jgi:hypothetical protein
MQRLLKCCLRAALSSAVLELPAKGSWAPRAVCRYGALVQRFIAHRYSAIAGDALSLRIDRITFASNWIGRIRRESMVTATSSSSTAGSWCPFRVCNNTGIVSAGRHARPRAARCWDALLLPKAGKCLRLINVAKLVDQISALALSPANVAQECALANIWCYWEGIWKLCFLCFLGIRN